MCKILVQQVGFFLIGFGIHYPTTFQPLLFQMRSSMWILLVFSYRWWVVLVFSLFLSFNVLTMMYPGVISFVLILHGVCWASWMWRLLFSSNLGSLLLIISSNFFLHLSPLIPILSLNMTLVKLMMPHISLRLCSFCFLPFSLFFRFWNLYWSIFEFAATFFCQLKYILSASSGVFISFFMLFKPKIFTFLFCNTIWPIDMTLSWYLSLSIST